MQGSIRNDRRDGQPMTSEKFLTERLHAECQSFWQFITSKGEAVWRAKRLLRQLAPAYLICR
jgi:hypothetical protein